MNTVPTSMRIRLCIEDMQRNRIPLFDGVVALLKLVEQVPPLAGDRDVQALERLLDEVEHLPIGEAREMWEAKALHRADRELMELERRHRDTVFYACRRLVRTLDTLPPGV
ncbi:MAG: DUF2489 domain-containing protein [Myxococcota bacterium]